MRGAGREKNLEGEEGRAGGDGWWTLQGLERQVMVFCCCCCCLTSGDRAALLGIPWGFCFFLSLQVNYRNVQAVIAEQLDSLSAFTHGWLYPAD